MRVIDILLEKANNLTGLKGKIIDQVQVTDDADLLNRIYSALNSTNLGSRIKKALAKGDNEVKNYLDTIANIIINTPGTVEEKIRFATGLPDGYVDIKKMVSGQRVHFEDLIVSNRKNAPRSFILRVMHALRTVGQDQSKGPGEFALAVLSPEIKIFGEGDLKIGNHKIEVKAGGGRLGATGGAASRQEGGGGLQSDENYNIISKYFPGQLQPDQTLGLSTLSTIVKNSKLEPTQLKEFANELFGYIFKGKSWVSLTPLINATVNRDDIRKPFVHAAFLAYKGPAKKEKFHGIMLMNFDIQELQYFEDFEEMYKNMYAASVSIISSNAGFGPRNILPVANLAPAQINPVELPMPGVSGPEISAKLADYAEMLAKKANQGRNAKLIANVTIFLQQLWATGQRFTPAKITPLVYDKFPEMRIRKPKEEEPVPLSKKKPTPRQDPTQGYPDVNGQMGATNTIAPPPLAERRRS